MTVGLSRGRQAVLRRLACAFVRAEAVRLRGPEGRPLPPGNWADGIELGERGLDLDSLERLGALGALVEAFHLRDDSLPSDPPTHVGDWLNWIEHGTRWDNGFLAVRTSGSTGLPKACLHDVAELREEARCLTTRLPDRRRVVALVPVHHLYGIVWTVFLPEALDVDVVDRTLGSPLSLEAGDLVVAVPDQWKAIERLGVTVPEDCIAVSSASTITDELVGNLIRLGFRRVIDIYGSSETGAIAMRDAPNPAYDLLPRWDLVADGLDWGLRDRRGRMIPLPDHVERLGERLLRPIARRDGAVQVGGRNVWPEHVANVLRETNGVADITVRLGKHGRLKAFVVPVAGTTTAVLSQALEDVAAATLEQEQRPRGYSFGASLPRNAMGKLTDWS